MGWFLYLNQATNGWATFFNFFGFLLTHLWLSYYLITTLQWYSYKLKRIIFNFHAPTLHLLYLLLPFLLFPFLPPVGRFLLPIVAAAGFRWQLKEGAKLTPRVQRFLIIAGVVGLIGGFTFIFNPTPVAGAGLLLLGLGVSVEISEFWEGREMARFYRQAQQRLREISPTVIGVTASYGKSSIKHFLAQLLEGHYRVYPTPGSVNTLKGVVKDINTSLPADTQIYIVEMGAREPGDIREIVELVQPEYRLLGKVGPQHLDYFKTLSRIVETKLEIFTPPFKKGVSYHRFQFPAGQPVEVLEGRINPIRADLDGIEWELQLDRDWHRFRAPILGEFNIINISLAVAIARHFLPISELQRRVEGLTPMPHRLQKLEVGGKLIIDDSFNGNLEGMLGSFRLVREYKGRKVVVTPGLVEVPAEFNRQIAEGINESFDLAIITGRKNRELFLKELKIPVVVVESKSELEQVLARETRPGDLILFSNDFPDYL